MKIYEGGKLIEVVKRQEIEWIGKPRKSIVRQPILATRRNALGSNQYQTKGRSRLVARRSRRNQMPQWKKTMIGSAIVLSLFSLFMYGMKTVWEVKIDPALKVFAQEVQATVSPKPIDLISPIPEATVSASPKPTIVPEAEKAELSEIVGYIAHTFEPEGKAVVVQAINCFYSESGLREEAVGQNNDKYHSQDHGVAQLNDHWHNLTEAQKTEYKANIDKAYQIYKGRGNFSAWYGKRCN